MNLFEAFTKIENSTGNKLTLLDIRVNIGCICKGFIIKYKNSFFIEPLTLSDTIILKALDIDMCDNLSNYKNEFTLMSLLKKIDVNLYRLQKISRF